MERLTQSLNSNDIEPFSCFFIADCFHQDVNVFVVTTISSLFKFTAKKVPILIFSGGSEGQSKRLQSNTSCTGKEIMHIH